MLVTKDALLADLSRALTSHHADSAEQMLAVMEPALAAGSPADSGAKPPKGTGKNKNKPTKLSGALGKYAQQAAQALIAAFPDRGTALADQLRMQIALGRIARWSEIHRPKLVNELGRGANDKDLAKLEKTIGMPVPVSLEALFRWRAGVKNFASFFYNNSLMDPAGSASTWQIMQDLIPQFEEEGEGKDQTWWRSGWIPFLENGGGDNICVDLEGTFTRKKGQIIQFWHDDSPRTVTFPDLPTWTEVYADSLEQGLWEFSEDDDVDCNDTKFKKLVKAHAPGYPKEYDANE